MTSTPGRRLLLAFASLLAAAFALLSAREASALSCRAPTHSVWPFTTDPVPTNVAIMVVHPTGHSGGERAYSLRTEGGQPVAVSTERLGESGQRLLALRPDGPLAAHTTHEVVWRGRDGKDQVLASLTTGAGVDTSPPVWSGPTGRAQRQPPSLWVGPSLEIPVGAARDDQTPPELVRYAVWRLEAGEGAASPPARPPDAIVLPSGGVIRLGGPWRCTQANFALPERGWPRLVVRPVDLAGNLGPAHVIGARGAGRRR